MRKQNSKSATLLVFSTLLISSIVCTASWANEQAPATEPAATQAADHINVGDQLSISVDDLVGLGVVSVMKPVVDKNGKIKLILLDKVKVDGLTASDAAKKIADAYKAGHTITNAQVRVSWVKHAD